jgi:biopolymer transport protein ExbB
MDYLAISVTEATLKFLKDGGIFIYPLLLCSIAGLAAIGFKFLALSRDRIIPDQLAHVLENASDAKQVAGEISKHQSALSRLAAVVQKNQDKDSTQINQSVEAMAREEVVKMHSGIGVLDVVITVSPLLGLLGTASGLVSIFQGLGETTDYLAIARGIAEALSTTIFGLAIAVPCVVAHSYFTRRIERLTARLESILTSFVATCSNLK